MEVNLPWIGYISYIHSASPGARPSGCCVQAFVDSEEFVLVPSGLMVLITLDLHSTLWQHTSVAVWIFVWSSMSSVVDEEMVGGFCQRIAYSKTPAFIFLKILNGSIAISAPSNLSSMGIDRCCFFYTSNWPPGNFGGPALCLVGATRRLGVEHRFPMFGFWLFRKDFRTNAIERYRPNGNSLGGFDQGWILEGWSLFVGKQSVLSRLGKSDLQLMYTAIGPMMYFIVTTIMCPVIVQYDDLSKDISDC